MSERTASAGTRLATAMLAGAGVCLLLAAACDSSSPTEPDPPPAPVPRAEEAIFIFPASVNVGIGGSADLTVRVQPPPEVAAGISTDLGNFGTDGGGRPIQVTTVPLDTGGSGRITWNAGDTPGTANIVANIGATLATLRATVSPAAALFLTAIDPIIGDPAGGDQVTISGQGFVSDPQRLLRVAFGGVNATVDTASLSADSVRVTTPASAEPVAAGTSLTVDVEVTLAGDSSNPQMTDTLPGAFTYTRGAGPGGPVVLSVIPTSGNNRGGERVAINGQGFQSPLQVAFGRGTGPDDFNGIDAAVQSVNAAGTQIVVTSPPAPSDLLNMTADVLVRNQGTGAVTLARALFTYQGELVVSDIQPREAPYTAELAGDPVTVFGRGFDDRQFLSIEFGGTVQSGGTVSADRTAITFDQIAAVTVSGCMPPSGPAIVTNLATGAVAQSGAAFSYTAPVPQVLAIDPSSGSAGGGELLTLTGTFDADELMNAQVTVDGRTATVVGLAGGQLQITAPAFTGTFDTASCMGGAGTMQVPKEVDVVVQYLNTGCSGTLAAGYSYVPDDPTCTVPDQVPQPSFVFGADPGGDPLTVVFTNTTSTTAGLTWEWFFGDGSTSTEEQPPPHVYPSAGLYTVILRATNAAGTGSFSQAVTVPLPGTLPDPPIANFTFSVVSPTVFFTNTTVPLAGVTWEWFFGDGGTSTAQDPTHVYGLPGIYTVTLRATNAGGTDTLSQQVTVP